MVFGGHGHDHWHVQLGASYWLTRTGSSEVLRRYSKVGYCFFDQVRLRVQPVDAPVIPTYDKDTCNGRRTLELEMGLSPGWTDPYYWTLPDQRLLVTGLADGVYRLWADADPSNWFRETSETNNRTWIDLRLTLSTRPPARRPSSAWGRPARPAGAHPELWLTCAPPSDGARRWSPTADATQSAATAASSASAARPMPMTRTSCSLAFPVITVPPSNRTLFLRR